MRRDPTAADLGAVEFDAGHFALGAKTRNEGEMYRKKETRSREMRVRRRHKKGRIR